MSLDLLQGQNTETTDALEVHIPCVSLDNAYLYPYPLSVLSESRCDLLWINSF